MALRSVFALKGGQGVTTAVTAVAATSANPSGVLIAELDGSGGDLAARFPAEDGGPSTVTLAEALRRCDPSAAPPHDLLIEHSRLLLGCVRVLVSPLDPCEVRAPLEVIAERAKWLASGPVDVIADCGRLPIPECLGDPASPAARLLAASSAVLAVCRPDRSNLIRLALVLPALRELAGDAEVQLIVAGRGDGTREDEIEEALGVRIAGVLPHDPAGADILAGRVEVGNRLRRWRIQGLPLLSHARGLTAPPDMGVHARDGTGVAVVQAAQEVRA